MLFVFLLSLTFFLAIICKRSPAMGCACLLVLHMLIPPCARILSISFNSLMLLIVLLFFVHDINKKNWKLPGQLLLPIKFLVLPLFVLSLFAPLSMNYQFSQLAQFFITEILIFMLLMYFIKNEDDLNKIFISLRNAYVVVGAYGILTYIIRQNPLFAYFAKYFEYSIDFTGDGTIALIGGMTGRASGNLSGPLPWGQTSLLMLLLFVFLGRIKNDKMSYIVVIIASLNCFLSTKRSVIVPMIIIFIYLLIKRGVFSKRNVLKILLVGPLVLYTLWNIPFFDSYKQNVVTAVFFWDDEVAYKNNVHGSSTEMRQSQLNYALVMVKDNFLCGLGYGYIQHYGKLYGKHPIMLGFESIIYQVLVPSGIIGLFIWLCFFYKIYRLTLYELKKYDALFCHGAYVLSCIMTGIQSSLFWYMVMVVLIYKKGTFRNVAINNNSRL